MWNKIKKGLEELRYAFNRLCIRHEQFMYPLLCSDLKKSTNYICDKCGSILFIQDTNENYIFYECLDCGKEYKAKKKNVLGRFKRIN